MPKHVRGWLIAALAIVLALPMVLALSQEQARADQNATVSTNTSFVNQMTPTTNYGQNTSLQILGTNNKVQVAYLEFTVAGIPDGATITSTSLDLNSRSTSKSGTLQARNVVAGFAEDTLTWNNRPTPDAGILASVTAPVNLPFSMPVNNVTGNGTYRYALTAPAGQKNLIVLASDEYSTPVTERPKLTVNYDVTPPTTTTTTTTIPPTTTTTPPAYPYRYPRPSWCLAAPEIPVSSGASVTVLDGTDARIMLPTGVALNERVTVNGGDRVCVVGGEHDMTSAFGNPDQQNGLWFRDDPVDTDNDQMEIWIEGYKYGGTFANDAIKTFSGDAKHTVVGSWLEGFGTQAGYHSDAIQTVSGHNGLYMDMFTAFCQFQCLMMKSDSSTRDFRYTEFQRVDFHATPTTDTSARALNVITSDNPPGGFVGPVAFGLEFFLKSRDTGLTSSIAPAAEFPVTGTAPNQIANPEPDIAGRTATGRVKQFDGSFEYTPENGNVGSNYQIP